jgi:histidine decarboxylase
LLNQLQHVGIGAMLNEFSNIVVFERPQDDQFTRRWNLACNGNIAHVVALQHITFQWTLLFMNLFKHGPKGNHFALQMMCVSYHN